MPDPQNEQRLRDLECILRMADEVRRSMLPPPRPCASCGQNPPQHPAAEALGRAARNIESAITLLRKESEDGRD